MNKPTLKPVALAIGTCLVSSLAGYSIADSQQNPFAMTELSSGYMVAGYEGVCGEGKCGGERKPGGDEQSGGARASATEEATDRGRKSSKEGQCGESKCGGNKAANEVVCGIYKVGSAHLDGAKVKDGSCGGHKPVEMLCGDPR